MVTHLVPAIAQEIPAILTQVLPSLADAVIQMLGELGGLVMQYAPALRDTALNLMADFGTYMREGLPGLMQTGLELISGIASSLRENAGLLIDSALAMIQSLAQGLAESLPVLIEEVPGIVSDVAGIINDNAPKMLAAAANLIGTLAAGLLAAIPDLIKNIPQITSAIWNVITAVNWVNLGSTIIKGLGQGITSMAKFAQSAAKSIKDALKDGLKALKDTFVTIGKNAVQGLINGIKSMLSTAVEAVKDVGRSIVSSITDFLGIHSPSTVFMTIGEYLMEGLEVGMKNNKGSVMQTVEDIANEVSDRFRTLTNAFDTRSDISDLRYQLWEMTVGKGASDIEKYNKKIEMLTDQEADQAGVVEAAKAAYQTMADQYGVNSAEAMSYMKTLLEEQIQYEKLAASIQEVIDKQRELAGAANISGSYADLAGTMRQGRSNLDSSLDRATANMVNGVSTAMSGGSGDLKVEVNVDGASLARATIADFRRVSKANPEAVNDR